MKDFFRQTKFKVLLCVFSLIFGILIYAAVSEGASTFPESVLNTITKPFIQLSTNISNWVEDSLDKFVNADKYKKENDELRSQLSIMYKEIMDKDKTDAENDQLKEMLKIKEEHEDFTYSPPCNIIAKNSNDIFGGFTIDRGSDDGIKLHDPVMTSEGLVGMISEIAPNYAKVTTILSSDINIGVYTSKEQVVGVIENNVKYADQDLSLMSYIDKESKISVGDMVVTSGGVVFPSMLLVGTVKEIYDDDNGLSVHAVIEPVVDVRSITSVTVITSFKGQGIES